MNILQLRSIAFLLLLGCLTHDTHAQVDEELYPIDWLNFDGDLDIKATESQELQIYDASLFKSTELDRLEDVLKETQREIRKLRMARQAQLESLLTSEQLQSAGDQMRVVTQERSKQMSAFNRDFAAFAEQLANAENIVLYEGIPRGKTEEITQMTETVEAVEIDSFYFYSNPLKVKPTTVEEVRDLLTDYRAFIPFQGVKFCGGFHPDICVKYSVKNQESRTHICLSCFEMLSIGDGRRFQCDFDQATWQRFVDLAESTFVNHVFTHPLKK